METKQAKLRNAWRRALVLLLGSCAVGPDYEKPDAADLTPRQWRWKVAEPCDAAPKGEWWTVFNDPALDRLEAAAVASNQTLRAAAARVDAARAAAGLARSRLFPSISLDPAYRRERTSGNPPTPIPFDIPSERIDTFSFPLDLQYEIDLWGRVRRSREAALAEADAGVADYRNVLLTLTADVAVNYILLRSLDAEAALCRRAVELHADSVRVLEAQRAAGAVSEIEAARAKAELGSAEAELAEIVRQREEAFNALALLCGSAPGSFQVPGGPMAAAAVAVPAGLPSSLLERRPDIAAAERNLAAWNARIGVAKAAYYPAVRLTGQAGYLSAEAKSLFDADSHVWSIAPSVSMPLFDAGRTAAEVEQAEAGYREALAGYRQTVLAAFKEVEDALAGIALRGQEVAAQTEALAAAARIAGLARARHEAGAGTYLEFTDAERSRLRHERVHIRLNARRLSTGVLLVKALGGGWGP
ncbi:MAG TPA: RND transporter [Planctomycetes bacterium]|nr:RND transporter [Planctomycetota bacterium]